jgi:hypothetical protein
MSSWRLVNLFWLIRSYLFELIEVRDLHEVIRDDSRYMDHWSLEADEEASRLDQAHAHNLGHQRVERQVLVEVDARENGFDFRNPRSLCKDRNQVTNHGRQNSQDHGAHNP